MKKYKKVTLEESRGMGVVETTNPQAVGREWILKKCNLNYVYIRPSLLNIAITKSSVFSIFHLTKSCDIQILDKEI